MSSKQMVISISRLLLRPFEPSDAAEIARSDPRTGPVAWAVTLKETGEIIRHAGISPKEELGGEVELGYAISERPRDLRGPFRRDA